MKRGLRNTLESMKSLYTQKSKDKNKTQGALDSFFVACTCFKDNVWLMFKRHILFDRK